MAVALYARVSTTRQAENELSIPDQLRQMREWCEGKQLLIAREYVEPGASATDEKRPVFQEMMADARLKPAPFEAIIVHSLSRFFRDSVSFGLYERELAKRGVRIVSVTQQTGSDPAGELTRRIFSVFDEYQSKENGKHTARAMRENARQGFFNGSGAPFGYKAVETEALGNRGRKKKKLQQEEAEAAVVRRIFELYLHGHEGRALGIKEIAKYLNSRGQLMRGRLWGIQKVHKILCSETYRGTLWYNVRDSRSGLKRPPSEWVRVEVPAIVDAEVFARALTRRRARAPSQVPPRRLASPNLLTGLLKCGSCGAAMTAITGKSGRYRYYRCTSRLNKGDIVCRSKNLPMGRVDELVVSQLIEHAFKPERVRLMLAEAGRFLDQQASADKEKLRVLQSELRRAEERLNRLYEAIETGVVSLDDTLHRRAQRAKAARESILVEMAGLRRRQALPLKQVRPAQVEAFASAICKRLRDPRTGFARDYLRAVVDEVVVTGSSATIRGRNSRLVEAITGQQSASAEVPGFMSNWRARRDSNSRPPGS